MERRRAEKITTRANIKLIHGCGRRPEPNTLQTQKDDQKKGSQKEREGERVGAKEY